MWLNTMLRNRRLSTSPPEEEGIVPLDQCIRESIVKDYARPSDPLDREIRLNDVHDWAEVTGIADALVQAVVDGYDNQWTDGVDMWSTENTWIFVALSTVASDIIPLRTLQRLVASHCNKWYSLDVLDNSRRFMGWYVWPDKINLWDFIAEVGRSAGCEPYITALAHFYGQTVEWRGGLETRCSQGLLACLCIFVARVHVPDIVGREDGHAAWFPDITQKTGISVRDMFPHLRSFVKVLKKAQNERIGNSVSYKFANPGKPNRMGVSSLDILDEEVIMAKVDDILQSRTLQGMCMARVRKDVPIDKVVELPLPHPVIKALLV